MLFHRTLEAESDGPPLRTHLIFAPLLIMSAFVRFPSIFSSILLDCTQRAMELKGVLVITDQQFTDARTET